MRIKNEDTIAIIIALAICAMALYLSPDRECKNNDLWSRITKAPCE